MPLFTSTMTRSRTVWYVCLVCTFVCTHHVPLVGAAATSSLDEIEASNRKHDPSSLNQLRIERAVADSVDGEDKVLHDELDHKHSSHNHDHEGHDEDEVSTRNDLGLWMASTAAIVAISLCGVFGVLVIPIMQKVFYQHLIQFLVALAIGTLAGDALLHLLPHALLADFDKSTSHHGHAKESRHREHEAFHQESVWKGFVGEKSFPKRL